MSTLHAVMSRSDVRGLLIRHTGAHVTDDVISAWEVGLAGFSLAECHAALVSMGPAARRATPSEVVGRCEAARDRRTDSADTGHRPIPSARHNRTDYHQQAGLRGIHAVYAQMGWKRNAEHDLARAVPCPFCRAKAGAVCGPLTRNRAGRREARDPVHRMHPSRLERAQADSAGRGAPHHPVKETSR
ncbi:hypothetical protein [Amycolatopsis sp. cmx-4-54]|uniref:zinc finger domain-containing protein n=1 Tax=Amycolatopsis sp. cmx-4-54 TaxID=2790936 RepID=UPI003978AD43